MESRGYRLRACVFTAVLFVLGCAGWARAQVVRGTGTANTIPLWVSGHRIGNSSMSQSGTNISVAGGLAATSFAGNGSGLTNVNAATLGGFSPSAFAQLAANNSFTGSNNSFTGNLSVGATLSGSTVNSGTGGFQFNGTPVLTILPGQFSLYVGQYAGANAGAAGGPLGSDNNTGVGYQALFSNGGGYNTAVGYHALFSNFYGDQNTALGALALASNTTGESNTALGFQALGSNTTGVTNTATGYDALQLNVTGSDNTADGYGALSANTGGRGNTAIGFGALSSSTGGFNTAVGREALFVLSGGGSNTAVGFRAGVNFSANESNNIDINNGGVAGDSGVIRIGTAGNQTQTFIAGISGVTTGLPGVVVVVDANGQLGTVSSSRRFKYDIEDMGEASDGLLKLRPVTFRYKKPYVDGSKPIQFGLIAEDVADVYPDLVVRGKDGQPETVQYYKLDAMLLNEVQKLAKLHAADQAEIVKLQSEIALQGQRVREQLKQLGEQMRTLRMTLAQGRSADRNEQVAAGLAPDPTKPTARK